MIDIWFQLCRLYDINPEGFGLIKGHAKGGSAKGGFGKGGSGKGGFGKGGFGKGKTNMGWRLSRFSEPAIRHARSQQKLHLGDAMPARGHTRTRSRSPRRDPRAASSSDMAGSHHSVGYVPATPPGTGLPFLRPGVRMSPANYGMRVMPHPAPAMPEPQDDDAHIHPFDP